MKKTSIFLLAGLAFRLAAQPVITSSTFQNAGDKFHFAIDFAPTGIDFPTTPPGGNQVWNFGNAVADAKNEVFFQPATAGNSSAFFPTASLVVKDADRETYYRVTNLKVENLGSAGKDPFGLNLDAVVANNPPVIEKRSPTQFFDIFQQSSNQLFAFVASKLPDNYYQGLPKPDSVRMRRSLQRLEVADAWGECNIVGGQYPTLRLKSTDYQTTSIDFHYSSPLIGWIDFSTLGNFTSPFSALIGTDTLVGYHFWAAAEKEEIATATLNNEQNAVTSLRFKDNNPSEVKNAFLSDEKWFVFPNPTTDWAWFDGVGLPAGNYFMQFFDESGRMARRFDFRLIENKQEKISLSGLPSGSYLMTLFSSDGRWLRTQKLCVH